jgi:hypothetical protein
MSLANLFLSQAANDANPHDNPGLVSTNADRTIVVNEAPLVGPNKIRCNCSSPTSCRTSIFPKSCAKSDQFANDNKPKI